MMNREIYFHIVGIWTHLFIKEAKIYEHLCSHISDQKQTHQIEAETKQSQEQGLVFEIGSELGKLIQHCCTDAFHVAKLKKEIQINLN